MPTETPFKPEDRIAPVMTALEWMAVYMLLSSVGQHIRIDDPEAVTALNKARDKLGKALQVKITPGE